MVLFLWILVQIMAESLPISSSGHVHLVDKILNFFGMNHDVAVDVLSVDFLLHGPTILILFCYFFTTWWFLIFRQSVSMRLFFQCSSYLKMLRPFLFVVVADMATFSFWVLDFAHYPLMQKYFLPYGFACTALCLLASRSLGSKKTVAWSFMDAIILGSVQGVSLLPGISRFASTYAAGLWLGYDRMTAFALSFLIQFPLLCAGFMKGLLALYHSSDGVVFLADNWIIGLLVAVSLISYKLFCWIGTLIKENRLWYFAYYMIIPIILSIVL